MSNTTSHRTIFDNGLALVTGHVSAEATNTVKIIVEIGSGSADDTIDGEAHFLEHMLFNGIVTDRKEIDFKTLRENRESKGIFIGANTSHNRTRYYADVPINLGLDGVKEAVHELSRMLISPTLPEERIAHEIKVICNEWGDRLGKVPTYLAEKLYIAGFQSNPAFGHRVLGEKETVGQMTRQSLVNFMTDHYTKPNTTIAIAGPIDHEEIAKIVENSFADMPETEKPDTAMATALEPFYETSEIGYIPHNFFQVNFQWPGSADPDIDPVAFLANLVISSRLNNTVRENNGSTYGLSVEAENFKEHGYLSIGTNCEPHLVPEITKEIAFELNQLVHGNIEEDLQVWKKIIQNGHRGNLYNTENYAGNLVVNERLYGILYDVEEYIARCDAVQSEDIKNIIRQSLSSPTAFLGMGKQDAFLPRREFEKIMRLQEPASQVKLSSEFKPNI